MVGRVKLTQLDVVGVIALEGRVRRTLRLAIVTGLFPIFAPAQVLPPECPLEATFEIVEDPAHWADQCFLAFNTRLPDRSIVGEAETEYRDIDLDGVDERLEIRGPGNASRSIYIFEQGEDGFRYIGTLRAHPSFVVVPDANGVPTIEYSHRVGVDDIRLVRIQYIEGRFVDVSEAFP